MGIPLSKIKDPTLRRKALEADLRQNPQVKPHKFAESPGKRMRQCEKPLLNGLEEEFKTRLRVVHGLKESQILDQAIRIRLANGCWYRPDFAVNYEALDAYAPLTFFEVKGPHAYPGAFEKLKVAARQYPRFRFYLVWKEKGEWKLQIVLP